MSTDLRQALGELADDAPRPAYDDAADLWRRGRRRLWRERVATGVAVVVVLACLGSLVGLGSLTRVTPGPTGPASPAGLPDRLVTPSPWLAGTDGHPLGRLAAVFGTPRSVRTGLLTTSSANGVVGVSTTGDYRFLDLPDAAGVGANPSDDLGGSDQTVSLSPDGTRVAFWLAGGVRYDDGSTHGGVVGYGLYDTETGDRWYHEVSAPQGLLPSGIAWLGDEVWFAFGRYQMRQEDAGRAGDVQVVRARSADLTRLGAGPAVALDGGAASGDGVVTAGRQWYRSPADPPIRLRTSRALRSVSVGPDGRRLAGLPGGSRATSADPVYAGRLRGDRAQVTALPHVRAQAVLGWQDERHVVVRTDRGRLESVDVVAGTTSELCDATALGGDSLQVAADALAGPVVPGRRPPAGHNPILVRAAALGAGLLALAGVLLLVRRWRRRVVG